MSRASVGLVAITARIKVYPRAARLGGFFPLLTRKIMILENIKNGCSITPEYFAGLHEEILLTHTIIQTPRRNGTIEVRIRKVLNDRGERINSGELFFYVLVKKEMNKKKQDEPSRSVHPAE